MRHHGSVTTSSHLDRITVDPGVCHGKPTVRGLRMTVQSILELLASGMTLDEVLADYPYLEREDLLAALEYGAATSGGQQVVAPSQ
jgi:uncharacterized protein (DUF433 family)